MTTSRSLIARCCTLSSLSPFAGRDLSVQPHYQRKGVKDRGVRTMTTQPMRLEDFRVRREVVSSRGPARELAVAAEMERRLEEGVPMETDESDVEEAVDRWRDPEPVSRSLVKQALWEMERHYWLARAGTNHGPSGKCRCGVQLTPDDQPSLSAMAEHKEDVLAFMLGLSIRPSS